MALTFACACGASICVPDVLAGHEGRCPGCDGPLRAPGPPVTAAPTASPPAPVADGVRVVTGAPGGALAPATKARLILEFPCPGCREVLRIGVTHAGKAGRCSLCGATFHVPAPPPEPEPPRPEPPRPEPPAPEPPRPDPPRPDPPRPEPPPARAGRDAFKVVRVDCECGKQVATPLAMLEQGKARCPSCDRALSPRPA